MTVKIRTSRRREIVDTLRYAATFGDLPRDVTDALEEAALLIEGRGIPFDELADTPNSHRGDPATSHGYRPSNEQHLALLSVYRWAHHEGGGLTPDEAAERAGLPPGPGPRKRVSELKNAGMVDATGAVRPTIFGRPAQVLAVTEFGLAELRRLGR